MDEIGDDHTKWSKSDRERQISYDIAYMWNLKTMIQVNSFTKQKQAHRFREWIYSYWREGWGGGIDWEIGIGMYALLYLKQKINNGLMY